MFYIKGYYQSKLMIRGLTKDTIGRYIGYYYYYTRARHGSACGVVCVLCVNDVPETAITCGRAMHSQLKPSFRTGPHVLDLNHNKNMYF